MQVVERKTQGLKQKTELFFLQHLPIRLWGNPHSIKWNYNHTFLHSYYPWLHFGQSVLLFETEFSWKTAISSIINKSMSVNLGQESCWYKRNLFCIVSITKALFCEYFTATFSVLSFPFLFSSFLHSISVAVQKGKKQKWHFYCCPTP